MPYKQPRSIQVVIFTENESGREFLLLRRVTSHGGFWQSVTGSLEEGETHAEAAVREVYEETGITCREADLLDLKLVNVFEIAPLWRSRFAPGVTHNEEICFALKVDTREVRVDTLEHEAYAWVDYETAMQMLYWVSSKRAFAALAKLLNGSGEES
ncbi:MAG TPA: dihydroneopterin triphosphate diphosphatase [Blastocatellia bacterium]|nr:dihydroneopterin triphosphate diphosphatase [Blastocatellia bacterium]